MGLHLQEGRIGIFREVFSQEQEREITPWYQFHGQGSQEVRFEKHWDLCKKHGGAYVTHNTCDCHRFEKDGKEKSDFRTAKKDRKKGNPINHNFVQLTKKIKKLKKALKKSSEKGKKRHYEDSDSDSE